MFVSNLHRVKVYLDSSFHAPEIQSDHIFYKFFLTRQKTAQHQDQMLHEVASHLGDSCAGLTSPLMENLKK